MLLSLFCGAGGLDLGFENCGYEIGLGFDLNADSVASYNHNRPKVGRARIGDVAKLSPTQLDQTFGKRFLPRGVIGGPPCQSFSQANVNQRNNDPRDALPLEYAKLIAALHKRSPLDFFVMENVVGLTLSRHQRTLDSTINRLTRAGFTVTKAILDAKDFGVPQVRRRLFVVGFNKEKYQGKSWVAPCPPIAPVSTVRDAIHGLPKPTYFRRDLCTSEISFHPNHWCMQPKSRKFFTPGALIEGDSTSRSFKTLAWDRPSFAVAYGHREVHIHPAGKRRLSVYEAMRLQSFPPNYELLGTLSSQIRQVSEAVPPLLAQAVATSIAEQLSKKKSSGQTSRQAVRTTGRTGKSASHSLQAAKS